MIRIYAEIFCWKNVSSFCSAKATHIFSAKKYQNIVRIKGQISAPTVCILSPFTALSTCFYQVPTTYISMEKWRKLSQNYHQILLNKSSGSPLAGVKRSNLGTIFVMQNHQRLRHRAAIKNSHLDTIFFLLLYHFLDHWLDLPNF